MKTTEFKTLWSVCVYNLKKEGEIFEEDIPRLVMSDVDYEWFVSTIPPAIVGGIILALGMYGVHRLIEYIIEKME